MAGSIEARLREKGITLPAVAAPAANYVPSVISGNMLYVSGQVPFVDGKISHTGKLGAEFAVEDGYACARICAINILAAAKAALGDLDRVVRVVKLGGFVNSTPDFTDQPKVVNGASDLMAEAFGDAGKHARAAVGVAQLPLGCAVEVEAIFEIR
ncbi:RidA family protein [Inquilinus limosus]|uniref:RidA family protein n=1 Tax=Inquilinus limosus TaxID=171674 RepID=UPI00041A35A4|nr:RidA family protein [Inquilinus limosus]